MEAIKKLIGTDTATFCIFDLSALSHRMADVCDWWSIEKEEIAEINKGNCVIFGTGIDGGFNFEIIKGHVISSPDIEVVIKAPSGKIYIGPGEDITGEDDQPEEDSEHYDGVFIVVEKGNYLVAIKNNEASITVTLSKTNKNAVNSISQQFYIGGVKCLTNQSSSPTNNVY